ncbi:enoyl-CoA hydratase/isomerase family protein [Streptomyces tricolor]
MTDDAVRHEVRDGVAYLTLNRPGSLNALTPPMRDHLIDLLTEASADAGVRAVLLTGTGRGFCAGADLRGGAGAPAGGAPSALTAAGPEWVWSRCMYGSLSRADRRRRGPLRSGRVGWVRGNVRTRTAVPATRRVPRP